VACRPCTSVRRERRARSPRPIAAHLSGALVVIQEAVALHEDRVGGLRGQLGHAGDARCWWVAVDEHAAASSG
jgi:hypothetical protein